MGVSKYGLNTPPTHNVISKGSPAGIGVLPPFKGEVMNRAARQKLKRMAKQAHKRWGKAKLEAVTEALLDQEIIDDEGLEKFEMPSDHGSRGSGEGHAG